jgi:hypothetical protein
VRIPDRLRVGVVAVLLAAVAAACAGTGDDHADGGPPEHDEPDVAAVPPPDNPLPTLMGSTVHRENGETGAEALARIDAAYGPIRVARIFSPRLPVSWTYLDGLLDGRPAVVSFRPSPRSVLDGRWDRALRAWFRAAPTDRTTWWAYYHEPEDDVERGAFRARQFEQAWLHVDRIARSVHNRRLRATVILMCWTPQEKSGRDWRDYVPTGGQVDVLSFDCYAKGRGSEAYADPQEMFAAGHRAARSIGAEWAVSELGAIRDAADDGTIRADWISRAAAWAAGRARFVTYFDADVGGDFRLTDEPSRAAWERAVLASPYAVPTSTATGTSGG